MREASKATNRRLKDSSFQWGMVLYQGAVLDVGSGDDPLEGSDCVHFDLPDGGGDLLTKFFNDGAVFTAIHGSQVLEHMSDPSAALRSWLELLRPGGHIVATVPDFVLYEKLCWPSIWNAGHRSTWSLTHKGSPAPIHCKLPEWLEQFPVEVLLCHLVDTNFDYTASRDVDQTFLFEDGVEAFVEFCIRKK